LSGLHEDDGGKDHVYYSFHHCSDGCHYGVILIYYEIRCNAEREESRCDDDEASA
jgi:hypothetical protein